MLEVGAQQFVGVQEYGLSDAHEARAVTEERRP